MKIFINENVFHNLQNRQNMQKVLFLSFLVSHIGKTENMLEGKKKIFINKNVFLNLENHQVIYKVPIFMFVQSTILENRKIYWGDKTQIFIRKNVFLNLKNPQVMYKVLLIFFGAPYLKTGKYAGVKKENFSEIKTFFST